MMNTSDTSTNKISKAIGIILNSYAHAINNQNRTSGSLFQAKTKEKLLETRDKDYALSCFNYIHQNPLRAQLVERIEDWEFSSFREYLGLRKETVCNIDLANQLLDLPQDNKKFYQLSYNMIDENFYR